MKLSDGRCTVSSCSDKNIYRMIGKCRNCGTEDVLMLFTAGHDTSDLTCQVCENRAVTPLRLATDDEIPVA